MDPLSPAELIAQMADARARTLALVEGLDAAQLMGPKLAIVNPLRWEVWHAAYFYEYWVLRQHLGEAPGRPDVDRLYDSITIAHDDRWDLPLPSLPDTLAYMRHVHERAAAPLANDPPDAQRDLQIPLLKNKYYFDEAYNFLFVRPSYWFAENVVYKFMDQKVIDGILHLFGPGTSGIGTAIRNYFDLPVINQGIGDGSYKVTWWFMKIIRPIQTGRVQQYLVFALSTFIIIGAALYLWLV